MPGLHRRPDRRNFIPLAGDRKFGDDAAIVGGFGRFRGESVCVIGHEKGSDTESRLKHNFGMARPEGYRKAVRLMEMADRFGIPVISLVDTAGAYPGIGAEERGQAEAIARSTEACLALGVPNVAVILGEGGSGGAIAHRHRQPRADAGARHLQRDLAGRRGVDPVARHRQGAGAATSMKITAQDMVRFGVIDTVVRGADRRRPPRPRRRPSRRPARPSPTRLAELRGLDREAVRKQRREKFLQMGDGPLPRLGGIRPHGPTSGMDLLLFTMG